MFHFILPADDCIVKNASDLPEWPNIRGRLNSVLPKQVHRGLEINESAEIMFIGHGSATMFSVKACCTDFFHENCCERGRALAHASNC